MSYSPVTQPWEEIPFSFCFPYLMVRSCNPNKSGFAIGYVSLYSTFSLVNERSVCGMIPFRTTVKGCRGPISESVLL